METVVATVSGYHGLQRFNLIKLISVAGASYVGCLTQSTTHLNPSNFLCSGEEMGPLLLEIPDVAKGDALIKKCKVFSDKSNVHDGVGNETTDVDRGASGLSGWSKSALLDENLFQEQGRNSSHKLKSKAFRKSPTEENLFSGRNCFQETSSTGFSREEVTSAIVLSYFLDFAFLLYPVEKHEELFSYASVPTMRNKRKISKNKEPSAHCSVQLMREERDIPNGSRGTPLAESSKRKGRRLVKNVNRESVVFDISDSDQECHPALRVHKPYVGDTSPSGHSLDRIVSLSQIGGPSYGDFSEHIRLDEEIEEVEEIKLRDNGPPSNDLISPGKGAQPVSGRTSPDRCSDAERENQDVTSRLSTSMNLSCVICWTEFSPTRGVLPCGHRFCYSCIQEWADKMTSRRKAPCCPLCKAIFMSITKVEDAAISDQKIFSQTIPCARSTLDVSILSDQERTGFGAQSSAASVCIKCRLREPEDLLISCHFCQIRNIHRYCLDPPLLPWTCIHCQDIERLNPYIF
ncbi:hypothetical protein Godav_001386 [Gossypium davidsonii]|uniref:RING-type domain-containing protein n=1 Tax=Gossypium davidsonii TaxID=34287 RepID=A0A7J8T4H6_GOSDV|nr:hypothetical protein [Gossypium davidsonii]